MVKVKEVHVIINDIVHHFRPKAQAHHVPQLNNIVHALIRTDQIDYQSLFTTVLMKYAPANFQTP